MYKSSQLFKNWRKVLFVFSLVVFISASVVEANTEFSSNFREMKEPPEGFSWQWMDKQPIALLVPADWYFYTQGDSVAHITKENALKEGSFRTGFTLTVLEYESKEFSSPEEQMKSLIDEIAFSKSINIIEKSVAEEDGLGMASNLHWIEFEKQMPRELIKVRIMYFYVNNADVIIGCIFESPKEEWEEAKEIGKIITSDIFVRF